ncbi:hypothetical protein [Aminobacterium colombiense]|uniref:hypothetical protein n=1 Tax=Aminobacterium colombiense TaxID=81468 RepID=UPI0025963721|nr:hypothetical protein [uncultured Aminobacterium sp.]
MSAILIFAVLLFGFTYVDAAPVPTKTVTGYYGGWYSSSSSVPNTYYYNDGTYSGVLTKIGTRSTTDSDSIEYDSYWGTIRKKDIYTVIPPGVWSSAETDPHVGPLNEFKSVAQNGRTYSGIVRRVNVGEREVSNHFPLPQPPGPIGRTYVGYVWDCTYHMQGTLTWSQTSYQGRYSGEVSTLDLDPPEIFFRNEIDTKDFLGRDWEASPVTVRVKVTDAGGSGYNGTRYMWSQYFSQPDGTDWSGWTMNSSWPITQNLAGEWYLHVEARDAAGNVSYRYEGPYRISVKNRLRTRIINPGLP